MIDGMSKLLRAMPTRTVHTIVVDVCFYLYAGGYVLGEMGSSI